MRFIGFVLLIGSFLYGVETVSVVDDKKGVSNSSTTTSTSIEKEECKDETCNTIVNVNTTVVKEKSDDFNNGSVESNQNKNNTLTPKKDIIISVTGQGVAPINTTSPAQAYALAKRAAIADAYRLLAEKVMGVNIEGQDLIKNMMVKRSTVRTQVYALVKNANIVETTFRDGLCEVEMEIKLSYKDFANK